MATEPKEYVRLPGRGLRGQGLVAIIRVMSTLWMGRDHLLLIDSNGGYSEDYRRFYYRDIQAITIRKTNNWVIWNIILAILFCGALLAVISSNEMFWQIFWAAPGAAFLLFLSWNALRGPTCVSHLRTAVNVEELPSMNRLRTARKVMERLTPLIEEAQGRLDDAAMAPDLQPAGSTVAPASVIGAKPTPAIKVEPPVLPYTNRAHAWLFSLLLVDAVRVGLDFFYDHMAVAIVEFLLLAAMGLTLVLALIPQTRTNLSAPVRWVTWGVMGYLLVAFLLGYIQSFIIMATQEAAVISQYDMLRIYSETSPFESLFVMVTLCVSGVCSLLLGGLGWLFLGQFYQYQRAPAPVPASPQPAAPAES